MDYTSTTRANFAPSVHSSRMTDAASEDADEYHPEGTAGIASQDKARKRSASGSNRPVSPPQSFYSRRGSTRRGFGGPGLSMANSNRVDSLHNRTSMTHAPSLTSRAFFRPMSSQRLQAQRTTRPNTGTQESSRLSHTTIDRPSMESNNTGTPATPTRPENPVPPSSRGTDFTEADPRDRAISNASRTANGTIQSVAESTSPLQGTVQAPRNGDSEASVFPTNFLRHSKNSPQPQFPEHERYSNDTNSPHLREKVPPKPSASGRNHEYFSGNTVFCWGGRLQNTRDRPINVITAVLMVVPIVLFFVFEAPYLWYNVSPAIPVIFAYFSFLCISSFLHASISDPGILPRNLHPLPPAENDDPLTLGPPTTQWAMVKTFGNKSSLMEVPTKYCKTCNVWRPPRAHHCRICDNCVETQDHHCVWLNNCVGRRNYRYFFAFVNSATILGILLVFVSLGQCLNYEATRDLSFVEAIDKNRVAFAMFLYGVIVTPYPACLVGYHLFLMGRGETTREYLNSHNFMKRDRHRPFDHGSWLMNWRVILLRERTPTYLRFKDEYTEGDPRFGPRKGMREAPLVPEQQGGGMEMQKLNGNERSFQGPNGRGHQQSSSK